MSAASAATNGASLEDSFSNVFVLTELTGVKWKKFVKASDGTRTGSELGSDPILWAYGACLSEGLLAVWRRAASTSAAPAHLSLAAEKELWVFWFSPDEPKELAGLTAALTSVRSHASGLGTQDKAASGSWEEGVPYECRTLLFKALHNLIERNLFAAGYLRLGRWFLQPVDTGKTAAYLDAFNFSFFLHGDNHVCVAVNTQRQPPVYKLSKAHLEQRRLEVMLAPWCWNGFLNPGAFGLPDGPNPSDDPAVLPNERQSLAAKQWKEWTHFFPLPNPDATENVGWVDPDEKEKAEADKANALPQMVEVNVSGVRILHPTAYIFVMGPKNPLLKKSPKKPTSATPQKPGTGPAKEAPAAAAVQERVANGQSIANCPLDGGRLVERAVDDLRLARRNSASDLATGNSGVGAREGRSTPGPATPSSASEDPPQWEVIEPSSREACSCAPSTSGSRSDQKGRGIKAAPFHRRSPLTITDEKKPAPVVPVSAPQQQQPSVSISSAATLKPASPPPSIALPNNLPPHEPITQMISPVPSSAAIGGAETSTVDSAFPIPSASSSRRPSPLPDQAASSSSAPALKSNQHSDTSACSNIIKLLHPSASAAQRKHPKRPRLTELDPFLATESQESMPRSLFLLDKENDVIAGWGNGQATQTSSSGQQSQSGTDSSIPGLISIRQGLDGTSHFAFNSAHSSAAAAGASATAVAAAPPAAPGSMPDNIMDTAGPLAPTVPNSSDLSPPASNERDECRKTLPNPPSVGPYANIYPTPPTPQVATSPEGLRTAILKESQSLFKSDLFCAPIATAAASSLPPDSSLVAADDATVFRPKPLTAYPESSKFASLSTNFAASPFTERAKQLRYQGSPVGAAARAGQNREPGAADAARLQRIMDERRLALQQPLTPRSQQQSHLGRSPYAVPLSSPYAPPNNPRTPLAARMDIHSPLSNAPSTPYHRHVGSVEPQLSCTSSSGPEAASIVAAVLLSDTLINIHRDTHFDSCPACVCSINNAAVNLVGNEAGVYLSPNQGPRIANPAAAAANCACGFSGARYRSLGTLSGLFAEDEHEATGHWKDRKNPCPSLPPALVNLLRHQALVRDPAPHVIYPSSTHREADFAEQLANIDGFTRRNNYYFNREELVDLMKQSASAMEAACLVMECTERDAATGSRMINRWGLTRAWNEEEPSEPASFSLLRAVGVVLEQSMANVGGLNSESVEGPLTWRALVRKSASSSNRPSPPSGDSEDCAPEPIPHVLVSSDKDCVQISPLALRLWDKLQLDPFSPQKDVLYVAVVPESNAVFARAQTFFRELSKTYESYRLGRHCPFTKALPRDGILIAQKDSLASKQRANVVRDGAAWLDEGEFLTESADNRARLRAYSYSLSLLGPLLQGEGTSAFDKSIFKDAGKESGSGAAGGSEMPPPSAPEATTEPAGQSGATESADSEADSGKLPHVVVVYLVNPVLEQESEAKARLSLISLLRSYQQMVDGLPANLVPYIQLEVIDLKTVLECSSSCERDEGRYVDTVSVDCQRRLSPGERAWERRGAADTLRSLAFSVYAQTRGLTASVLANSQAKCLTGLGPTASYLQTVQSRLRQEQDATYRLHCASFILPRYIPGRGSACRDPSSTRPSLDDASTLYFSYCLSDKLQNWLLVTATDGQGTMLESSLINIATIQERKLAKPGEVIRAALHKLWRFVISVLATGTRPWRLVIGRLGRLGHGELKVWAQLLSKAHLKKTSTILRENCAQCSSIPGPGYLETPSILSAALVSLEPEAHLRLFPHQFKADDRFGLTAKSIPLATPEDVSATHILVFPTSAKVEIGQGQEEGEDEGDGGFEFGDLGDLGGLDGLDGLDEGLLDGVGVDVPSSAGRFHDSQPVDISVQPMAIGIYISTAPARGLPHWFWMNASAARRRCPVHLRSALHINTNRVQDTDSEFSFADPVSAGGPRRSRDAEQPHPLDSRRPPDVLRHVLQTYNALSWLSLNLGSGERRSCLPIHIQALLRLYHATNHILNQ